MSLTTAAVCLIACHGGPADHFATFAENLIRDGYQVEIYASGPALKKFQERNMSVAMSFNADNLTNAQETELAAQIAQRCTKAAAVLTDVGHHFDIALQHALAEIAPEVLSAAFYDNPEPYVPGGYSSIAAQVMLLAKRVLFANANLAREALFQEPNKEIILPFKERFGIGYYPVAQADRIAARRAADHDRMRKELFSKHGIEERGQKALVYFGGNNEEYFTKAFPAFLTFLSEGMKLADLSKFVIVLQQHPGAKGKNIDRMQLEAWIKECGDAKGAPTIVISDQSSDEMQVVADGALFYQTSMGPLFALAGIPTLQVGHETFKDVLVRGGLCQSVTNASDFVKAASALKSVPVTEEQRRIIFKSLGIKEDWFRLFKLALQLSVKEASSAATLSPKRSVLPYFLAAGSLAGYLAIRILNRGPARS